jgi:hypothetical protein
MFIPPAVRTATAALAVAGVVLAAVAAGPAFARLGTAPGLAFLRRHRRR